MSPEVYQWVVNASSVSTLLPLVCLLVFLKRQPKQNLILAVSLSISFLFDVIGWSLARWYGLKATVLSNNLYFIIAFPAIMWFYHETVTKRPLKIIIRVFTIGFLALALIFGLEQGLAEANNTNTWALSSILITLTSFFFVADLNLMDDSNFLKSRFHESNIILNTSLALYYFITIIMFSISQYVFTHTAPEGVRLFWACHNALNVLKNAGIAVAFYLSAKSTQGAVKKPKVHHDMPKN